MSGSDSDTVSTSEMVSGSPMDAQQNLPRVPSDIKFRVLIIGRANAGKTSVLQRVCDTTENPEIYNIDSEGVGTRVRSSFILVLLISSSHQVQQLGPSQEVQQAYFPL